MPTNAALFLFLAAAVVAVFAFSSIVAWISTPARERQARDRLALLKTLAEHPGDHARQVLDFLREEDEFRTKKKEREDQRGWIVGGLILIAVGVRLGVMLGVLGDRGDWSVALIPLLIDASCWVPECSGIAHRTRLVNCRKDTVISRTPFLRERRDGPANRIQVVLGSVSRWRRIDIA